MIRFGSIFLLIGMLWVSCGMVPVARAADADAGQKHMRDDPAWLIFSGGVAGLFDAEKNPLLAVEYRFAYGWGGLHPWLAASWATDGAIFLGGGLVYSLTGDSTPWRLALGFGPGYYEWHEGVNLGAHLEFISFVELGYALPSRHVLTVKLAHVSNGSISSINPGTELFTFGYAIPF